MKRAPQRWLARHGDALYAFTLKHVFDPATAEDRVQETLLAALQGQHGFRAESAERTWLVGILKYKCVDELRRRERAPGAQEPYTDEVEARIFSANGSRREAPGARTAGPLTQMQRDAFVDALGRCLNGVPDTQRRAFVMRELQGLDTATAGARLGVTASNLYVLLHRARLRLRNGGFAMMGLPTC